MATKVSAKRKNENLYRYISFERLCDLFETKQLFFAHPTTWQKVDPYETILDHDTAHRVFALCWCRESYSDAMWRIYCGEHAGVRIGTTMARLRTALESARKRGEIKYGIKRVRYPRTMASYRQQIDAAQEQFRKDPTLTKAVGTLFLKRRAYRHECETRAVISVAPELDLKRGATGYKLEIDPHQLIRSVLIHPRASADEAKRLKQEIEERLGFKGAVKQSLLYTYPEKDA